MKPPIDSGNRPHTVREFGNPRANSVRALWILLWMAAANAAWAQGPVLEITAIELRLNQVTVQFRDTGTAATSYRLEHATTLRPPVSWAVMDTAAVTSVGPGEFRSTAARPPGEIGFIRVMGTLSGGGEIASAAIQPGTLLTREGGGSGPRLVFSKPYTGTLRYVYSGPGIEESGEVRVAGATEVLIPAPKIPDDEVVDGLRFFSLRLEKVSGADLALREISQVVTDDNDEVWRGFLEAEGTVAFNLLILRSTAGERAWLRGDATSFFPPGDYAASALEFSSRRFHLRIPAIEVLDSSPPFEGPISIDLELTADAPANGPGWVGDTISGRYTWRTTVAGRPFLNTTQSGEFHVKRQPSTAPAAKLPLTDLQP